MEEISSFKFSKMAVSHSRHLRSAILDLIKPEIASFDPPSLKINPILEPNVKRIGWSVAEISPFEIFQMRGRSSVSNLLTRTDHINVWAREEEKLSTNNNRTLLHSTAHDVNLAAHCSFAIKSSDPTLYVNPEYWIPASDLCSALELSQTLNETLTLALDVKVYPNAMKIASDDFGDHVTSEAFECCQIFG